MMQIRAASGLAPRIVSPFAPSLHQKEEAGPLDTFTATPSASAPEPPAHLGRSIGVAVALGLSFFGVAAPAAAQALQAPPVSQSQTSPAAQPQTVSQPTREVDVPPRPLPTDTLPPAPLPEARPARPEATHMFTGAENHFGFNTRTQSAQQEKYTYGQFEAGRRFTLDLEKGPWHSETTLDAAAQARLGFRLDPNQTAGNLTAGVTLGETLSRDLGSGFSAYGRASVGIQGGFGTRFEEDEPLNAVRTDGAVGLQYSNGLTTVYGEGFAERATDLGSKHLSHDRVGARVGAQHLLTERDAVQVELNASRYTYSNGVEQQAVGGSVGYLHRTGNVWWGPQVGVEHRGNNDNRISAGVRINF